MDPENRSQGAHELKILNPLYPTKPYPPLTEFRSCSAWSSNRGHWGVSHVGEQACSEGVKPEAACPTSVNMQLCPGCSCPPPLSSFSSAWGWRNRGGGVQYTPQYTAILRASVLLGLLGQFLIFPEFGAEKQAAFGGGAGLNTQPHTNTAILVTGTKLQYPNKKSGC